MRVLIDARLYGLENAGLGRYAVNLIEELKKLDTENEYIVLLRKKYFDSLSLPKNFKKILADFRHYSFKEQLLLPKIINTQKPDLTHFLHFNVPIWFKGKFVVTIHDLLMHKQKGKEATTLPLFVYNIKRHGYKTVFKKAVTKANHIIVPSKAVKAEVTSYYKIDDKKITVTYEGGSDNYEKAKSDPQILKKYNLPEKYFLYVGNAYPHKNLKRAIEAAVFARTTLVISSSRNEFTKRLEEQVEKLHAKGNVKLLGFVPDEDLVTLYRYSQAFVFPSLSEGFGLPGLEAIMAGTVVIASEIPVFKEIYKDNVIYFNPFDFSNIAKKMEVVINLTPNQRKEVIAKSQEFAKNYSWKKMAQETLQVYSSI